MKNIKSNHKELIELIQAFFVESTFLICESKSLSELEILNEIKEFELNLQAPLNTELPQSINQWFETQKTIYDNGDQDEENNCQQLNELPPLVIETVLDISQLSPFNYITLKDKDGNLWNVCKGGKKSEIVLERWLIELDNKSTTFQNYKREHENDDKNNNNENRERKTYNEIKKQLVLLARYLHTLIGLLPTSFLTSYIQSEGKNLKIRLRTKVIDGSQPILSKGRIGLSKSIINTYANTINESNIPSHLEQRKLTPVWTELGLLRISSSYRVDTQFEAHSAQDTFKTSAAKHMHSNPEIADNVSTNIYLDEDNDKPTHRLVNTNIAAFTNSNDLSIPQLPRNDISLSVSPHTDMLTGIYSSPYSSQNHSINNRKGSLPKNLNPFKPNLSVSNSNESPTLFNNTSNTSIKATLRYQRSRNSSISGAPSQPQDIQAEGSSIGSSSKYSSSFNRLRRHSSIKSSELNDNQLKSVRQRLSSSDDLLDFMKLLDDKQELNVGKSSSKLNTSTLISNSLLRYQKLKSSNNVLSEDLSLSVMGEPNPNIHRRSSISNSSLPSVSPPIQYSSIYSRLSKANALENEVSKNDAKLKQRSYDNQRISVGIPLKQFGSITERNQSISNESLQSAQHQSLPGHDFYTGQNFSFDEDDELLASVQAVSNSKVKNSTSPHSIDSINNYISKNKLPFQQSAYYSNPTTSAVPAYAKLHKPNLLSTEMLEEETNKRSQIDHENNLDDDHSGHIKDDEDELLFFMSDMNISKD